MPHGRQISMPTKEGKSARDPETITLSMQVRDRVDGENALDIYVKHQWVPMWCKACTKTARSKDTIVLDEDLADYVLDGASSRTEKVEGGVCRHSPAGVLGCWGVPTRVPTRGF